MANIVLTRIDNRLIHGQLATQWCGRNGVTFIFVANDELSTNNLRQRLMDMAAPSYIDTCYWSVEKTISAIGQVDEEQAILLLCKEPQDILRLVEGGVPISKVSIGNTHMAEGKRKVANAVAVNDDDVNAFRKLRQLGVELEIRRVPLEAAENIENLFK